MVAVLLVTIPLLVGLPTNVASSDTDQWPWGLELLHQHPWSAMVVLALVLAALTVIVLRTSWRAEDAERVVAQFSPEALAAAAETLTVNMRDELDDQLRRQLLYRQIDLALGGDPTDPGRRGPARLLSELPGVLRNKRRRLVVVGLAGSGKSTVLMLLARQLIAERAAGGRVPVVVNLSTWDPRREHLDSVIRRRIQAPARSRFGRGAGDLVSTRLVLPVLDGLDELPESLWEAAANGLRAALEADDREFILACGQDVFTDLVPPDIRHSGGTEVVSLRPVDLDSTIGYLRSGLLFGDDRWEPVFTRLRQQRRGALATALSSPLMMHLALVVYQDRATDPTRMCDTRTFPDLPSLESHLLSRYLGGVYGMPPMPADPEAQIPRRRGYSEAKAHRWLTFLAGTLSTWRTTSFMWWHLHGVVSLHDPAAECTKPQRLPSRWYWRPMLAGLLPALGTLLGVGVIFLAGLGGLLWQTGGLSPAVTRALALVRDANWLLVAAGFVGLVIVIAGWQALLVTEPGPPKELTARSELAADRRLALVLAIYASATVFGAALAVWRLSGYLLGWSFVTDLGEELPEPFRPLLDLIANDGPGSAIPGGILAGIVLVVGVGTTAWAGYRSSALLLAVSGRVPLRLLTFLEDAQARGVLRRNGTAYEFRHRSVQRHLARGEVSADPVDRIIDRARESFAAGRPRHAYRLLENRAMYEVVARRALIDMFGDVPTRPVGPIAVVRNARKALAAVNWWTRALEDDVPDAALGLSDLYEWIIAGQPAVPFGFMRALWIGDARKFWDEPGVGTARTGRRLAAARRRNAYERNIQDCLNLVAQRALEFVRRV